MGVQLGAKTGLFKVSEMLSNQPGSVSHSKLVTSDVVRCQRLIRQGVNESRAEGNGTLVVSHT